MKLEKKACMAHPSSALSLSTTKHSCGLDDALPVHSACEEKYAFVLYHDVVPHIAVDSFDNHINCIRLQCVVDKK